MLDYKNGISLVFFFSILLSISILVIISFCPFLRAFTHLSCTIEQNQTILDGLLLSDFFFTLYSEVILTWCEDSWICLMAALESLFSGQAITTNPAN